MRASYCVLTVTVTDKTGPGDWKREELCLLNSGPSLRVARAVAQAHLAEHPDVGRISIFRGRILGRHVESLHGSRECGAASCERCYPPGALTLAAIVAEAKLYGFVAVETAAGPVPLDDWTPYGEQGGAYLGRIATGGDGRVRILDAMSSPHAGAVLGAWPLVRP